MICEALVYVLCYTMYDTHTYKSCLLVLLVPFWRRPVALTHGIVTNPIHAAAGAQCLRSRCEACGHQTKTQSGAGATSSTSRGAKKGLASSSESNCCLFLVGFFSGKIHTVHAHWRIHRVARENIYMFQFVRDRAAAGSQETSAVDQKVQQTLGG